MARREIDRAQTLSLMVGRLMLQFSDDVTSRRRHEMRSPHTDGLLLRGTDGIVREVENVIFELRDIENLSDGTLHEWIIVKIQPAVALVPVPVPPPS